MTRLSAERFNMQQRIKEGQRAQERQAAAAKAAADNQPVKPGCPCAQCDGRRRRVRG